MLFGQKAKRKRRMMVEKQKNVSETPCEPGPFAETHTDPGEAEAAMEFEIECNGLANNIYSGRLPRNEHDAVLSRGI